MTLHGGLRCGPQAQTRLKRATCAGCKFWTQTGENAHTGRQYGECLLEQLTRFGGDAVCSLFEARK